MMFQPEDYHHHNTTTDTVFITEKSFQIWKKIYDFSCLYPQPTVFESFSATFGDGEAV